MMTIKEIYEDFDKIGCLSFATLNPEDGYIDSRIAHFFAYDDEGIYFRTMITKPFYKQLMATKKISVCGMYPKTYVDHDENGLPHFAPGYTMRITGDMREVSLSEIKEKAITNEHFAVAVHDIEQYPATRVFVLYCAKGEKFDFDFEKEHRNHKLLRERFTFGGMQWIDAGLSITDSCIKCGKCKKTCSFDAIEEGSPYKIISSRCDECGSCFTVCPVNAILSKG